MKIRLEIKVMAAVLAIVGLAGGAQLVGTSTVNAAPASVKNSKVVKVVQEYAEILRKYKSIHGEYPNVSAEYACLPTSLPATKTFPAGVCEVHFGTTNATTTPDGKDFLGMLKTVQATFPDAGYGETLTGYNEYGMGPSRGIIYTDEAAPHIEYIMRGDVACPIGEAGWGTGLTNTRCSLYL